MPATARMAGVNQNPMVALGLGLKEAEKGFTVIINIAHFVPLSVAGEIFCKWLWDESGGCAPGRAGVFLTQRAQRLKGRGVRMWGFG
jgi:hypothetical protein